MQVTDSEATTSEDELPDETGIRQTIQCGKLQILDSILGMYPPFKLAYPVEVYTKIIIAVWCVCV